MRTIIVTGGAGFIGSHFIQLLKKTEKETRIVNLDALTYAGSIEQVPTWIREDQSYHFVQGDIRDRGMLAELFAAWEPDAVVNFAAESHVDRSIRRASLFLETNLLGAGHLMDAARDVWQGNQEVRFVQISTDEVYGPVEAGRKVNESAPLLPGNPYAASKAAADLLALSYFNTYGFPVIITRCTNNYGPGQHGEKLIPTVLRHLKEGRGTSGQRLDPCGGSLCCHPGSPAIRKTRQRVQYCRESGEDESFHGPNHCRAYGS